MEERDRYLGALVGLAVGDAVGTTLEFMPPGSFKPVTDMTGGGPFIPAEWRAKLAMREMIESMAMKLLNGRLERQE